MINPPFGLEAALREALPFLRRAALSLGQRGWRLQTPEIKGRGLLRALPLATRVAPSGDDQRGLVQCPREASTMARGGDQAIKLASIALTPSLIQLCDERMTRWRSLDAPRWTDGRRNVRPVAFSGENAGMSAEEIFVFLQQWQIALPIVLATMAAFFLAGGRWTALYVGLMPLINWSFAAVPTLADPGLISAAALSSRSRS